MSMAYWEDLNDRMLDLDLAFEDGDPVAHGRMMNKLFVIRLRRGEPVDARELGERGEPSIVFDDPAKVYQDVVNERINPFRQVADGRLKLTDFAASFLFSKAPGRFYCGPLLYFRRDTPAPLPQSVTLGLADWQDFLASAAQPLPVADPDDAPFVEALLMQRVLNITGNDGRIVRVLEAGTPPTLWDQAEQIWADLCAGLCSPYHHIPALFGDVEDLSISLFYVKDRHHIGYEVTFR